MRKMKQNIMKYHACNVARVVACVSFLVLTIIGVSSLVKAMSLEKIENENGVPAVWKTASLGNPDTITVPITYWDQRQDTCEAPNQQFEWVMCGYWTKGVVQGLVQDTLGADGTPVPTFTTTEAAWNQNRDVFTRHMTGNNPLQPTDNFYRWFHGTNVSEQHQRDVTFQRVGKNTYEYGGHNIFPLDDVAFSDGDTAWDRGNHNYHFTGHLSIPIKVAADGTERFSFSGDDDVWVFLNGKLVLDIGGLHEKIDGSFVINKDGTISTYVQHVNDTSTREFLGEPSNDFNSYVNPLNEHNMNTFRSLYRGNPAVTNPSYQSERYEVVGEPLNIGIKPGDVVNLDFFYAERSTDESNTKITISNMIWPISADSQLEAEIVGQTENNTNIVEYHASVKNRDPINQVYLERMAAYVNENNQLPDGSVENNAGFIPLTVDTLYYTKTPEVADSWELINISAPHNSDAGFILEKMLTMAPAGTPGDTLYFKYYAETLGDTGNMDGVISFYTTLDGASGVTYDDALVSYKPAEKPKHNLTIKYLWEDGSETGQPDYIAVLPEGGKYEVESPKLEDGVLVDEHQVIVYGEMGSEDVEIIVYYRKKPVEEKTYRLIVRYQDEATQAELADPVAKILKAEADYEIDSPEIEDYELVNAEQAILHGQMPSEADMPASGTVEVIVWYRRLEVPEVPRQLVIEYKDRATGEKLSDDYSDSLFPGDQYEQTSPKVPGYQVDPKHEVVKGEMPEQDVLITVYYDKIPKHQVVIHYVYEDGSEARPDFSESYVSGDEFSVKSPEIDDYEPDQRVVQGVVKDNDLEYTVIYKRWPQPENPDKPTEPNLPEGKYDLTIKYVYEDGSEARPSYEDELASGEKFEVKSPEIDGYVPDLERVSGEMKDGDLVYTVIYKLVNAPEKPTAPVINNGMGGSNLLGDLAQLGYLKPLGEVAFVPNTGVVSHAASNVFRQHFADIVLSQGFILLILLIFAISFAIYFSLRKYRDLERAKKIGKMVDQYGKKDKVKLRAAKASRVVKTTKKSSGSKTKVAAKAKKATVKKAATKTESAAKTKPKTIEKKATAKK